LTGRAEVIAVALVAGPRVQRHAHAHPIDPREVLGGDRTLRIKRRRHRGFRAREDRAECIADRFEDVAAVCFDRIAHQCIMTR